MKKYKLIKFGELQIGDNFRYKRFNFHKTLEVNMGTFTYNAITDWIGQYPWQYQQATLILDNELVKVQSGEYIR